MKRRKAKRLQADQIAYLEQFAADLKWLTDPATALTAEGDAFVEASVRRMVKQYAARKRRPKP